MTQYLHGYPPVLDGRPPETRCGLLIGTALRMAKGPEDVTCPACLAAAAAADELELHLKEHDQFRPRQEIRVDPSIFVRPAVVLRWMAPDEKREHDSQHACMEDALEKAGAFLELARERNVYNPATPREATKEDLIQLVRHLRKENDALRMQRDALHRQACGYVDGRAALGISDESICRGIDGSMSAGYEEPTREEVEVGLDDQSGEEFIR